MERLVWEVITHNLSFSFNSAVAKVEVFKQSRFQSDKSISWHASQHKPLINNRGVFRDLHESWIG